MSDPRDKLPTGYSGSWIATFQDPPLDDHRHDRIFGVGPVWRRITLVEMPGPHGWTIVAGDGIPDFHTPRVPWDGEVTYRLTNVVPLAGGDGEPVAYYAVE